MVGFSSSPTEECVVLDYQDIYLQGKKSNEYDLVPPSEPDWEKTDKP
jgi:hypothetical protein